MDLGKGCHPGRGLGVVERAWGGPPGGNIFVANLIEFFGGNPWADVLFEHDEGVPGQGTGFAPSDRFRDYS